MKLAVSRKGPKAPSDPHRSLVTPEGVDLRIQIGEAGQRATAFIIDIALMLAVLIIGTLALMAIALASRSETRIAAEAAGVIWLVGWFLLRNFYFIGFELGPRAATPGKRAAGLRVASRDGGRLTFEAVFLRNALRELEFFLPLTFIFAGGMANAAVDGWIYIAGLVWSALFLFFPLFNRDRLRMGDLAAGTWVVKAPRRKLPPDLSERAIEDAAPVFAFTPAQADAYGVKELHVLEEVLRAKDAKTMAAVAARIRTKIGWSTAPWEKDADFLSAYYAALRRRLEQRLLMGKRRADKHDV